MRRHRTFGRLALGDEQHLSRAKHATEDARWRLLYALDQARKGYCRSAIYYLTLAARMIGNAETHLESMANPPHGIKAEVDYVGDEILTAADKDIGLRC